MAAATSSPCTSSRSTVRRDRLLAQLADGLLIADVQSHHPYLVQTGENAIGLPDWARIDGLIAAGRASLPPGGTACAELRDGERRHVELDLLARACVRNGTKAIAIWMHAIWTPDLVAAFGPHDDPATLKRWRTVLGRMGAVAADDDGGAGR